MGIGVESGAYHSDPGLLVAEQVIIANLMALYWMIAMQLVRKVSSACYAVAAVFDMCSFCTTCFALIAHGDLAPTKLIQDKDHRSSVRSASCLCAVCAHGHMLWPFASLLSYIHRLSP